jgi:3-hydroxybutyryl-CoA dehydrogenase
MMMNIKTVGVVGAGTMGRGIAHLVASSGYNVILYDLSQEILDQAVSSLSKLMDNRIERGKMTAEEKEQILNRIALKTDLNALAEADLSIEAVIENLEVKKDVFKRLDDILPREAILATNTSSMSITVLGAQTKRPEQVAGMHFFNPPQVMKLVEVVRGYYTSDQTIETIFQFAKSLGKEPVEVKKDSPGFIVNRIMLVQFIEAMRLVEEGVATPEDIDKAVTLGLNYPMGPFTLQDFAGVDIGYYVMEYLYDEFKDARFAPPQSIKQLIKAGRLGKKTGAGWFDYDK